MIAWSIEAALKSGCFDDVIVSTDDDEIAGIAKVHGASVPFMRPDKLADDFAGTMDVLRHAVDAYEKNTVSKITEACCIYATAPFVDVEHLRLGLGALLVDAALDFAFSVASFPFPVQRSLELDGAGRVHMVYPEYEKSRSQDLVERFHDAGQFYWFRRDSVFSQQGFFSAQSASIVIPRERVQDIDTMEDWRCAELAHELLEKKK